MHARLGAVLNLEAEAKDGSHRRPEFVRPILFKHRRGQIRSQRLIGQN
jgi:hypothetical protein